jgi:hypothetical protein
MSEYKDNSPSVYPSGDTDAYLYGEQNRGCTPGLSLRDYFAGQALIGLASSEYANRAIAMTAYGLADAMLEERVWVAQ